MKISHFLVVLTYAIGAAVAPIMLFIATDSGLNSMPAELALMMLCGCVGAIAGDSLYTTPRRRRF